MAVTIKETRNYAGSGKEPRVFRHGVMDLGMLSRIARRERVTLLTTVALFLASSILYLHLADPKYSVRIVITGVATPGKSGGGAIEELGSLAGLDVPAGAGNPQFRLFVGTLHSPFAAEAIAGDQDLLKAIFPREWSASEGRWRPAPSFVRPVLRPLERALGFYIPPYSPPGVSRVYDYLKDQMKVFPDSKSGTVTLEIQSAKPEVAARILTTLNNALDERMRQHDLTRATTDTNYLTQRLSNITVDDYRKALVFNLIEQERIKMLASAPLPYVSDSLGKPMVSARPVSPVPLAVLAAALILGGVTGMVIASIRYRRRPR